MNYISLLTGAQEESGSNLGLFQLVNCFSLLVNIWSHIFLVACKSTLRQFFFLQMNVEFCSVNCNDHYTYV